MKKIEIIKKKKRQKQYLTKAQIAQIELDGILTLILLEAIEMKIYRPF